MENFYNKVIFDITQLILNKNYKRAIALGEFLLAKGFRTAELIVTLSYAQRVLYGAKEAINFLQQHMRTEQSTLQEQQRQSISSPLIQLALSEYHIQSQNRDLAVSNLSNLLKLTNTISPNSSEQHPRLPTLIYQLSKSYQSQHHYHSAQQQQLPNNNYIQEGQGQKFIQQINNVTRAYLKERDQLLLKEGEMGGKGEVALKYGQYYVQYEEIKGRILMLLSEHIRTETNRTVGKRIKRKQNKFLRDTSSDKLKGILPNQKIKKQTKQQAQYQKIAQKQPSTKLMLQHTNSSSRSIIMQASQIQQLQGLLVHVNGFVTYFKGRLRECSNASRVKDLNVENGQSLGEDKRVEGKQKQNNWST